MPVGEKSPAWEVEDPRSGWSLRTGPGLDGRWAPWAEEVEVVGCPF